jgi:nitrate reductase gamma subunit
MDTTTALWNLASAFIIGLAYVAGLSCVFGLLWKLVGYVRTPMPWPAAVTPAPVTEAGAVARVAREVLLFTSLFRADPALWAGSWLFHVSLLVIVLRHLRYFTYPVPALSLYLAPVALVFGCLFGLAVLYLFWRRVALPRPLYVSNLPDYAVLVLLGAIAGTGLLISYVAHVPLVEVKAFVLGLLTLRPVPPPQHPLFLVHFLLVLALLLYFPFSKLLHAGGVFVSPTRAQPFQVQVRGKRYTNPWDYPVR